MAFKLTRQEITHRDEIIQALRLNYERLETTLNEDPPDQIKISEATALFSVILDEAEEFRDEIATRLREEYDDKSEKWQEGDKGGEVDSFISEWEEQDFSCELDLLEPDIDGLDEIANNLEDLSIEA